MTMKSTLIVPITLLATLAAGVLVHDRLGTKPSVDDAAPTRTASVATPEPTVPLPVSPQPVSAPAPASQEANLVQDAALTRTASIATPEPAAPPPVSPPPVSAPAPSATPEPERPRRMTASQEASLDTWMIKTYLLMLEAGGSACRRQSLCRAGAPQIQIRRIAPEAAEARQSAVRSGAKAAGKERVAGCQGMRPFTDAGSISLLL